VRAEDTVARLGGDEFGILLIGDDDHSHVGERILASLRDPFRIGAQLVTIQASMGLAVPDPDGAPPSAEGLLRRADAAMYAGKRGGKGSLVHYRPGLTDGPPEPDLSDLILADLAGGSDGGLDVVYQPIVEMRDGLVVAVEALVRWSHPDLDAVPAEEVVAAAERAGVIDTLDDFVLDRACREIAAYLARYGAAPRLHVNVSAGRLGGADLETSVEHALCRHGLTGDRIVLEVTEGSAIPDLGAAARSIRRFRAMGVKVALDDFGTGHNTILRLHQLPVDIIKIDRTLTAVDALPTRAELLCGWLVALAVGLDMAVIAEGVEHPEQAAALQRAGSRYGQGYLYGRPAPLVAAVPPWATVATPAPRPAPAGDWDADGRMPDLSEESDRGYAREILTPDG
jgi:predicted signal transduction protein with EAL and GGDEF domain